MRPQVSRERPPGHSGLATQPHRFAALVRASESRRVRASPIGAPALGSQNGRSPDGTRPGCSTQACIARSRRNASGMPTSASRSISTRTFRRTRSQMRRRRSTPACGEGTGGLVPVRIDKILLLAGSSLAGGRGDRRLKQKPAAAWGIADKPPVLRRAYLAAPRRTPSLIRLGVSRLAIPSICDEQSACTPKLQRGTAGYGDAGVSAICAIRTRPSS